MTTTTDDLTTYRLGAFIAAGMDPEKALALSTWIDQNNPTVAERLATVERLTANGLDYHTAFTVLFCHPSDHEPYLATGNDYLATRGEEVEVAHDPESQ